MYLIQLNLFFCYILHWYVGGRPAYYRVVTKKLRNHPGCRKFKDREICKGGNFQAAGDFKEGIIRNSACQY
jgi:hypothetical protein